MKLSLILAVTENRVIGRDNDLPWHLPADLKRFKTRTTGHAIIMGRKTFESIGCPLPRRRSIVLSKTSGFHPEGTEVVPDLDAALELTVNDEEAFVIGGASVFAEALPRADCLYVTRVHAELEGDVFCPPLEDETWERLEAERHEADERHAYAYTFETWTRRAPA